MFKGDSLFPSLVTSQKSSEDEAYRCRWQKGLSAPRLQLSPQHPCSCKRKEKAQLLLGRRCHRSHMEPVASEKGAVVELQSTPARRRAELRDARGREVTGDMSSVTLLPRAGPPAPPQAANWQAQLSRSNCTKLDHVSQNQLCLVNPQIDFKAFQRLKGY